MGVGRCLRTWVHVRRGGVAAEVGVGGVGGQDWLVAVVVLGGGRAFALYQVLPFYHDS